MPNDHQQARPWYVNIPLADLNMLVGQLDQLDKLSQENQQLRREMDGLRTMYSELLQQFGDLRKSLKGR